MKITYVNDQLFPSSETDTEQLMAMVSAFSRAGADMKLLLPVPWLQAETITSDVIADYYEIPNTFSLETAKSVFPSFRTVEKIGHAFTQLACRSFQEADIIYTRNIQVALVALAFSKKQLVYETYRPWPKQYPKLTFIYRWMVKHPRFLGAVFHSKLATKSFLDIGLAESKGLTALCGYDPKRMEPVISKKESRNILSLDEKQKIVTYTGHVSVEKGLLTMLELASQFPKVLFVIVGSTTYGELEKKGDSVPNVIIVNWQKFSKTIPYIYGSDILFIPPTAGPLEKIGNTVLPMKTFLYMASGRPILAPSTPDLQEVLNDRNALLVPPDNLNAAKEGLEKLLISPSYGNQLAEQALQDVSQYRWELRSKKVLNFLKGRMKEIQTNKSEYAQCEY